MTRPLRVMIDARMLLGRPSGVGRFVTRLVDELIRRDDVDVTTLCGDSVPPIWRDRTGFRVVTTDFSRADRTALRRLRWETTRLSRIVSRAGVDVFHATWNSGVPSRSAAPSVVTVHDLIPYRDPETYFASAADRWAYRWSLRSAVRRAAAVTTVSGHVRGELIRHLGLNTRDVSVVANGTDIRGGAGHDESGGRYALYVGGCEPRKNLTGVLNAVECYRRMYGGELELVLTGDAARLDAPTANRFALALGSGIARFVGDVSDDELNALYHGASVLLMLSRDEGFGIPVIEAMGRGCPVVAANCASLPEIVGDAGMLVDPDDAEAAAAAMHGLIDDTAQRAEFIRRGRERAATFSWETAERRYSSIYADVARMPDSVAPGRLESQLPHTVPINEITSPEAAATT